VMAQLGHDVWFDAGASLAVNSNKLTSTIN
jgi:hypothetical protein